MKTKSLALACWGVILLSAPASSQNSSCPGSLGPNVFPDGDIGAGIENVLPDDPGIAPGYWYATDPPPVDGAYTVANSTVDWDWFAELFWLDIGDNSPDTNGYMMVVNASHQPGLFFERTVSVCENTPYVFSADIINLFKPEFTDAILPNVDFLMDGTVVYSTGDIPMSQQWQTFEFNFTPPPGVSQFTFSLRNNAPGGFGNDLALDNISLRFCGPKLTLPTIVPHCDGSLSISPIFEGNPWQNAYFQWQTSTDGGQTWTNLVGAIFPDLNQPNALPDQQFRLLVAGAPGNLSDPFCRAVSNIATIQTPVNQGFAQQIICQGDSLVIGGNSYTAAGSYQIPLIAADGCDSLLHLYLEVLPLGSSNFQAAICEGEAFPFGNDWLMAAGTYSRVLSNSHGCDSTVTLNLTVNPKPTVELFQTLCEGESVMFDGELHSSSGDFFAQDNLPTGCDSTTILHLEILPQYSTYQSVQICEGAIYQFGNQALTSSGQYSMTVQSIAGCDSTINLDLEFLPEIETQIAASICQGSSYLFGNQQLTAAETYQQQLQTANGCDSMVTLQLTVLPVIAQQISASICQGTSYLFGNQQLTTAGTYQQQLQTASGCDSTVTLELAVLPVIAQQITASICQGSSYLFGNQQLTAAGSYQQQIQTASGCDSMVTLELAVLPVIAEQITASICQGDSYLLGNQQLTAAGIYQQQLQTAIGCDSTVTLELAVLPVTNSDAFVEICEGDPFNGSFYQQNTLLVDTFQAASTGCDSIVLTHLTVWPKANVSLQDFRCWGDTFEGIRVFSDTVVLMVGQTLHGCDSFTVCTIDVNPVLLPQITAPDAICKGETAVLQGSNSSSYLWSTGEHASSISVQQPGEYQLTITDTQGCTATAQHQLAVSAMEADLEMQPPLCVGDENGVIGFELEGGFPPYLASLDGLEFQETERFANLPTGNYELYFRDQLTCNLKHEVHLPDPPVFEVKVLQDATLKLGETMDLSAVGTLPIVEYIWWPIVGLDCANCPSPTAMPLATSDYWIFAKNENGCEAEASVRLVVTKDEDVYVPNVFSPNGDGINDFFTLYPGRSVLTIKRLLVFDRWGEPVFECYDAPPFHPLSHWHGKFKDMPAQSSVYVWLAEIEYIDGTTRLLKGDVSLMR